MANNIEDILRKTEHLKSSQKLEEVSAGEVFSGVKNFFRSNIDNEQNRALYKQNLKVLQSFEQLINDPKNKNKDVATAGKKAEDVMKVLNAFSNNADWYALVMGEQSKPEADESAKEEQTKDQTTDDAPVEAPVEESPAPAENVQEAIEFLANYNELLREDLEAYASKNIDKNAAKVEKQKKQLFKQCRQILYKQGGKSNTLVALFTALKQNADLFNSTYAAKKNGVTAFFSDWLAGKLMSPEEALAAQQKQVEDKANDAIIQCLQVGYSDYNSFVTALKQIAGVQ